MIRGVPRGMLFMRYVDFDDIGLDDDGSEDARLYLCIIGDKYVFQGDINGHSLSG